jgi:hypothetical protein
LVDDHPKRHPEMMTSPKRSGTCTALLAATGLVVTMAWQPLMAHHSVVAHYLVDETVSVTGVVEEFWFENPHARIVLDVTTEAGGTERWIVETGAKNNMIRNGWDGSEFQPGDVLSASGLPSRDGSNTMELRILDLPDGRQFRARGGSLRPVEENQAP